MQIRVIKTDGQAEPYLHTKVLGTFHHALGMAGDAPLFAAEQMAEAVTFYLYRHRPTGVIASDEIHLMIESVLTATGFAHAAEALNRYRLMRRLKRRRIEVLGDAGKEGDGFPSEWSKSRLADSLVRTYQIDVLTARAIAGAIEEKVMGMNVTKLRKSLLRQLILGDVESFMEALRQLGMAAV
jgi:2-phosphoglycerate kinase